MIRRLSASIPRIMAGALGEWTHVLDASFVRNFQQEGRPKKWAGTKRGGKILQKSGRLRNSIGIRAVRVGPNDFRVIVRTNKIPYARIHQYGGWIKPTKAAHLAIPLTKEARRVGPREWDAKYGEKIGKLFPVKKPNSFTLCTARRGKVTAQYSLKDEIYIPGRPYIVVQVEDRTELKKLVKDYAKGLL